MKTIDKCIETGDFETANLNFAKLVEAMRQQNEFLGNTNPELVKDTERKYEEFREKYGFDYPQQFLPPQKSVYTETKKTIEESDIYLIVYETLNNYYELTISDNIKNILRAKTKLFENIDSLRKVQNISNYENHVKKGINFFNENNDEDVVEANNEQINCVTHPSKFNENEFYCNCLSVCFDNFYYYWNTQLSSLKRKDAILKRINYLIEESNNFMKEAKRFRALDLVDRIDEVLKEYDIKLNEIKN
jgi:hypothetical protein